MSTLLVDELFPTVVFSQPVKFNRNMMIAHVRPWIYKRGVLVDGDFNLDVYDGATLLATSTINYATINAAFTENYAHGYMRFDFESLQLNVPEASIGKEYEFRFSMLNHTLDSDNFMAIVRQYEHKIYTTYGDGVVSNEAPNDSVEPAGIEIYEFTGA